MKSAVLAVCSSLFGPPLAVQLGSGVRVGEASSKGLGAFATTDLSAGAFLGRYTGRLYTETEALDAWRSGETSGEYFATLRSAGGAEPMVVDAEDYRIAGWPRFINHSKRLANCRNTELRKPIGPWTSARLPLGLYVQATRDIAAGEELLVDYGPEYWT